MTELIKRFWTAVLLGSAIAVSAAAEGTSSDLAADFQHPPNAARPWVYWYFMDGNLNREGMTADLEAMKKAGIGGALYLEVGIGVPSGPVKFMSEPWRELLRHAMTEADRLGLQMALGAGPGWCGTGGPWVKPEQSMQHLVASETVVNGPTRFDAVLPRPEPRKPFFGEGTLTPEMAVQWKEFYRDVVVLAFPMPEGKARISDVDEKALYYRAPYSSQPGVKPFLPASATYPDLPLQQCVAATKVIDLSDKLGPDGRLVWEAPAGKWMILRFGRTLTGQTTRPAPDPGLGFESDKFDRAAVEAHFEAFVGALLKTGVPPRQVGRGLTTLHFDSWEMSSQNWSAKFREEFQKRRGYDLLRFLPVMVGYVVDSLEISERFLWDLRQTAQELVVENHALALKELGRRHGLQFSVEPYDLNPCADLTLGSVADVPQCEFWSKGYGFQTEFSCIEAVSVAHTLGRPVVAAEAFTADDREAWRLYPGAMKDQTDWALCCGINRLIFHRYQAQPWLDRRPGMTMGPYGVHWERTQTWWEMVPAYHDYLSRCQQLLRRGLPVADILYLAAEGAPHVFRAPKTATTGDLPDRRGYNFDGCAPGVLIKGASVRNGRIVFPDGMSYGVLVLPEFDTMTPGLLRKIQGLVESGATVIGSPPQKSPSLEAYPECDRQVKELSAQLWGKGERTGERKIGKGRVIRNTGGGGLTSNTNFADIYPSYESVAQVLSKRGVPEDFATDGNVRYIHRREGEAEIYFIASRENRPQSVQARFRVSGRQPEWWDPVTGERRDLTRYEQKGGITTIPLRLEAFQSAFIIFQEPAAKSRRPTQNFPELRQIMTLTGPWEVSFDPKWGGPEHVRFERLEDWAKRPEPGIRYYSGSATYRTSFVMAKGTAGKSLSLSLGKVAVMAQVKVNGRELGVVWCDPWRVTIPKALLREGDNQLEITVANLWINRLIGDAGLPKEQRRTWTTWSPYQAQSPLEQSGLLGPVIIEAESSDGISNRSPDL